MVLTISRLKNSEFSRITGKKEIILIYLLFLFLLHLYKENMNNGGQQGLPQPSTCWNACWEGAMGTYWKHELQYAGSVCEAWACLLFCLYTEDTWRTTLIIRKYFNFHISVALSFAYFSFHLQNNDKKVGFHWHHQLIATIFKQQI